MSLLDCKNAKEIAKIGGKLGREGIAKLVLQIAKEIVDKDSYKEAIKGIGKMIVLGWACNFDTYWREKRDMGKVWMYEDMLIYENKLNHEQQLKQGEI